MSTAVLKRELALLRSSLAAASRHAARPAPRWPGGADRRRGIRVRDELWATISPMLAARRRRSRSCSRPRPAPAASFIAPGTRTKTGSGCRSPPINARAFPLSISPPSVSGWAMLSTGRSISVPSSRPGSVFDAEVLAHMLAITLRRSPREPVPIVEDG